MGTRPAHGAIVWCFAIVLLALFQFVVCSPEVSPDLLSPAVEHPISYPEHYNTSRFHQECLKVRTTFVWSNFAPFRASDASFPRSIALLDCSRYLWMH